MPEILPAPAPADPEQLPESNPLTSSAQRKKLITLWAKKLKPFLLLPQLKAEKIAFPYLKKIESILLEVESYQYQLAELEALIANNKKLPTPPSMQHLSGLTTSLKDKRDLLTTQLRNDLNKWVTPSTNSELLSLQAEVAEFDKQQQSAFDSMVNSNLGCEAEPFKLALKKHYEAALKNKQAKEAVRLGELFTKNRINGVALTRRLYKALILAAKLNPVNPVCPFSQCEPKPETQVVISTGHQFGIAEVLTWLATTPESQPLVNPCTRKELTEQDECRLIEAAKDYAKEKNLEYKRHQQEGSIHGPAGDPEPQSTLVLVRRLAAQVVIRDPAPEPEPVPAAWQLPMLSTRVLAQPVQSGTYSSRVLRAIPEVSRLRFFNHQGQVFNSEMHNALRHLRAYGLNSQHLRRWQAAAPGRTFTPEDRRYLTSMLSEQSLSPDRAIAQLIAFPPLPSAQRPSSRRGRNR